MDIFQRQIIIPSFQGQLFFKFVETDYYFSKFEFFSFWGEGGGAFPRGRIVFTNTVLPLLSAEVELLAIRVSVVFFQVF